jgi:hypothetical protein
MNVRFFSRKVADVAGSQRLHLTLVGIEWLLFCGEASQVPGVKVYTAWNLISAQAEVVCAMEGAAESEGSSSSRFVVID